MTALTVAAVILAACAGAGTTHACWLRAAETHHWQRTRLEYLRVDRLYHDRDHYAREARRLTDEHAELREGVGQLLDTVAHQQHIIEALTPSAMPDYGIWRERMTA